MGRSLTERRRRRPPLALSFELEFCSDAVIIFVLLTGCCCGKRNKLPVTVSKYARTITQTIRRTVTATKKAGRLRAREAWNQDQTEAFFESTEDEYLFDPSEDTAGSAHVLFARHLCPVCPQDAAVAAVGGSKNNNLNANSYKYCCPARKTITKTMKKTLTKRRTVTVIKTPASVDRWIIR